VWESSVSAASERAEASAGADSLRRRAAWLSLAVAILLLATKTLAYLWTESTAVLSDALESTVNLVAALFLVYIIRFANKPADDDHPYGHGKAEDFAAGVEGALIVVAALTILVKAVPRFFHPHPLEALGLGSLLVAGAASINLVVGLFLIRVGERAHSRALIADGKHLLSDVVTSVGALVALLIIRFTDLLWMDPLMACMAALYVVGTGVRLVRDSIGRLMDEADDPTLERLADALAAARRVDWVDIHHLRAWRSGAMLHADLHLTLPRFYEVQRAHLEGDLLRDAVRAAIPAGVSTMVHVDPCDPTDCHGCALAGCAVRGAPYEAELLWDREGVTAGPGAKRMRRAGQATV
jgi:cation diffusion facilitator family transporter